MITEITRLPLLSLLMLLCLTTATRAALYTMPAETEPHEGTWLQWPHDYEYGNGTSAALHATWVAITKALVQNNSEKVHIIAYNSTHQTSITNLLTSAGLNSTQLANWVDFYLFPTNDVWVRDNGPIFVRDQAGNLLIEDWGFNGWGGKYGYSKCNQIPAKIGTAIGRTVVNLNAIMVNEGGSVELDGNGVLMATKSSIISQSPANSVRNPGMTQAQAEAIFRNYLGVSKFIWLEGKTGDSNDITDMHIDGFTKFVDDSTIITMNDDDLADWGLIPGDINKLKNATDINNDPYIYKILPLTQNTVKRTNGTDLGYKGSYLNYYVANKVVLVSVFNDPNDAVTKNIIQSLYPGRLVVGINVQNLYEFGGMVHCITQQQPIEEEPSDIEEKSDLNFNLEQNYPNPFNPQTTITYDLREGDQVKLAIYNLGGELVKDLVDARQSEGCYSVSFDGSGFNSGVYFYKLEASGKSMVKRMLMVK